MLEFCRAIIVAPSPIDGRALTEIADAIGFGDVVSVFEEGSSNGLRYPVSFFLVHHRLAETDCEDIIDAVRRLERNELRYSPIVMMLPEASGEAVRKFVRMGFDDVVSLPQSHVQMTARLGTQLDREIVYFQTIDYLGPDRRRLEADATQRRLANIAPHTQLVIRRDPDLGNRVLSRQLRGHQNFQTALPAERPAMPATSAAPRSFGRRQQPPTPAT